MKKLSTIFKTKQQIVLSAFIAGASAITPLALRCDNILGLSNGEQIITDICGTINEWILPIIFGILLAQIIPIIPAKAKQALMESLKFIVGVGILTINNGAIIRAIWKWIQERLV